MESDGCGFLPGQQPGGKGIDPPGMAFAIFHDVVAVQVVEKGGFAAHNADRRRRTEVGDKVQPESFEV